MKENMPNNLNMYICILKRSAAQFTVRLKTSRYSDIDIHPTTFAIQFNFARINACRLFICKSVRPSMRLRSDSNKLSVRLLLM